MKPSFGFIFTMSFVMSLVMGAVMSTAMMLHNGQPLEAVPLLISTGVATVIGVVVMLVIPAVRMGEKLAEFYGASRNGLLYGILQALVINTIMTFCVSFGMTAFATGFATFPDGTTFVVRWLDPIVSIWGTAYLATVLAMPVATAIARKVGKAPVSVETPQP